MPGRDVGVNAEGERELDGGGPARADPLTPVTVTFTERGDKPEMFLHQTGLTDLHRRAGVHDGWSSALDKFADLMGAQR